MLFQNRQRTAVLGFGTDQGRQALHRFHIVVVNIGTRVKDGAHVFLHEIEIGNQHLNLYARNPVFSA